MIFSFHRGQLIPSTKELEAPIEYIDRCIVVSVQDETTIRTPVDPDTQALLDHLTTPKAFLTSPSWIDLDHPPTSFFRFVNEHEGQEGPICTMDLSIEPSVSVNHSLDIQIFNSDNVIFVDQFTADHVQLRFSTTLEIQVSSAEDLNSLPSTMRSLLPSGDNSLDLTEFSFGCPEGLDISKDSSVRYGYKIFNPEVDSDCSASFRETVDRDSITHESGVPTISFSSDPHTLDIYTFRDFTPRLDLDRSNPTDLQPSMFFVVFPTCSSELKCVESISSFESWEPRGLTGLNSTEEGLKSSIKTFKGALQKLEVDTNIFWDYFPKGLDFSVLVVERETFPTVFVGKDPLFEGYVIEVSGKIKKVDKGCDLEFGRIDPELVTSLHNREVTSN